MNIFKFLILTLVLISCSKNGTDGENEANKSPNYLIEMEEVTYTINSDSLSVSSIDFTFENTEQVEQKIRIYNRGRAAIHIGTISLGTLTRPQIVNDGCSNKSLNFFKSCYITLKIDGSQYATETLSGSLDIDILDTPGGNATETRNLPINITSTEPVVDPQNQSEPAVLIFSSTSLNLGEVKVAQEATNTLTITNRQRATQDINFGSFNIAEFSVKSTSCGSSLSAFRRCTVEFAYNAPSEILLDQLITDTIQISGNPIEVYVNLIAEPVEDLGCSVENPDVTISGYTLDGEQRIIDLTTETSSSLGIRNGRISKTLCQNKNNLNELKVSMNGCEEQLGSFARCSINFTKNENLSVDHEIFINGVSYLVKTGSPSVDCLEADAQSNGYDTSINLSILGQKDAASTDVSQCSITCPEGYSLDNTLKACIKPCDEASATLNSVTTTNASSYEGTVVGSNTTQCLINSCQQGYNVATDKLSCIEAPTTGTYDSGLKYDSGIKFK